MILASSVGPSTPQLRRGCRGAVAIVFAVAGCVSIVGTDPLRETVMTVMWAMPAAARGCVVKQVRRRVSVRISPIRLPRRPVAPHRVIAVVPFRPRTEGADPEAAEAEVPGLGDHLDRCEHIRRTAVRTARLTHALPSVVAIERKPSTWQTRPVAERIHHHLHHAMGSLRRRSR